MYKYIEEYKQDEIDQLFSRILTDKLDPEGNYTRGTYEIFKEKSKYKSKYVKIEKTLPEAHIVRCVLLDTAEDVLNNLKRYLNDYQAILELEKNPIYFNDAIEQVLLSLEAIYNLPNKKDEVLFIEAREKIIEVFLKTKSFITKSDILNQNFNMVVFKSYYEKNIITQETVAQLYINGLIKDNNLDRMLNDAVIKKIKTEISSSKIFKLNEQGVLTDKELLKILTTEELLKLYQEKNKARKFLAKIPTKKLIQLFLNDEIGIEEIIKLNMKISELFKEEKNKISAEEFIKIYEKISNLKTKEDLLPSEKSILDLYNESLALSGRDMLKLYNLGAVKLKSITEIYEKQDKEEPDTIEIEDIEKIFTSDKIYELYKNGGLDNGISAFYIINIKQGLKEIISSEISEKLKAEENCALCGIDLFRKGILLLKDIEQNKLINESDWINSYANQLEENQVEQQNIVEDLMKAYNEDLISPEAVSVLIEDFNLQDGILKICDENKISTEKFNEISEMSFPKEYFIKAYEKEIFKTKQPIIMAYNANMLTEEDFKSLYREGIILEDEIFELAKLRLLSEEKIIILYTSCMLSEDKLNDLFISGIISEENKQKAMEDLDIKKVLDGLEPFLGKIDNIYTIEDDIKEEIDNIDNNEDIPEINIPVKKMLYVPRYRNQVNGPTNYKYIEITLPIAREKLFVDKYKAIKIPSRKINMPRGSSFENYEFYLLLEQDGITKSSSIIIGERYYKDKFEAEEYNLVGNNATYLFTVKDLMRLFNKSDDEREKIAKTGCDQNIIKINHNIDPKLPKTWAERLGKAIAQMKGHRNLESIYMPEEIQKIREWEEQIDSKKRYTVDIYSK